MGGVAFPSRSLVETAIDGGLEGGPIIGGQFILIGHQDQLDGRSLGEPGWLIDHDDAAFHVPAENGHRQTIARIRVVSKHAAARVVVVPCSLVFSLSVT